MIFPGRVSGRYTVEFKRSAKKELDRLDSYAFNRWKAALNAFEITFDGHLSRRL